MLTSSPHRPRSQLNDARTLLASTLDPPELDTVTRAEQFLLAHGLFQRQPLGTRRAGAKSLPLQPTPLGRLVDALPLEIESAKLVLLGALCGLLDEAVALAVIRSQQPMLLKREPNKQREYEGLIARYGPKPRQHEHASFTEDEMLANFAAYACYEYGQTDVRRLRQVRRANTAHSPSDVDELSIDEFLEGESLLLDGLKRRRELNGRRVKVGKFDSTQGRYACQLEGVPNPEPILVHRCNLIVCEVEWCRQRSVSHASLLATERTIQHVVATLYHHLPPLLTHNLKLRALHPPPLRDLRGGDMDGVGIFSRMFDDRAELLLRKLLQTLRPQNQGDADQNTMGEGAPCAFFRRGCCSVAQCPYRHVSSGDARPVCSFALKGPCKFGASCRNRHPMPSPLTNPDVAELQRVVQLGLGTQMDLYVHVDQAGMMTEGPAANCEPPADLATFRSILLVGEGDFTFSAALAARRHGHNIFATTVQSEAEVRAAHPSQSPLALEVLREAGVSLRFNVDARRLDEHCREDPTFDCILWNLPFASDVASGQSVKTDPNKALMRSFFAAVIRCVETWAVRPARGQDALQMPVVMVSVGTKQFADWALLTLAHESFLRMEAVRAFERPGRYAPRRNERDDAFDVGEIRTYQFAVDWARLQTAKMLLERRSSSS